MVLETPGTGRVSWKAQSRPRGMRVQSTEHVKPPGKPPVLHKQRWKGWPSTKHVTFERRGFIYNETQTRCSKRSSSSMSSQQWAALHNQNRTTSLGRVTPSSDVSPKSQTGPVPQPGAGWLGGGGSVESAAAPPPAAPGGALSRAASGFHLAHGLHEASAVGDGCRQENEPEP